MWLFITARLRQWLFFALVVPVAVTAVHLIRVLIEKRTGETALTRLLVRVEGLGRRR